MTCRFAVWSAALQQRLERRRGSRRVLTMGQTYHVSVFGGDGNDSATGDALRLGVFLTAGSRPDGHKWVGGSKLPRIRGAQSPSWCAGSRGNRRRSCRRCAPMPLWSSPAPGVCPKRRRASHSCFLTAQTVGRSKPICNRQLARAALERSRPPRNSGTSSRTAARLPGGSVESMRSPINAGRRSRRQLHSLNSRVRPATISLPPAFGQQPASQRAFGPPRRT